MIEHYRGYTLIFSSVDYQKRWFVIEVNKYFFTREGALSYIDGCLERLEMGL